MKKVATVFAACLGLAIVAAPAMAGSHSETAKKPETAAAPATATATATAAAPAMPEMSAEEKAMMEAYAKAGAPGPQHASLASTVGKWDVAIKSWMSPGAPPMESKGTSERTVILDGRVLAEKVHSEMMGTPFEGHGMTGYDNVSGKYWGTWNDSMSTGLFVMHGTCTDAGACTFTGSYMDPVTKQEKKTRSTSQRSADKETVEMFETGADGKEVKTMELTYTRAAAAPHHH